ncbi:transposase, partial [Campylobacter sp. RM9328]|uniref:IS110 family transposase n=1 Tax=Campylobacter sp. RM9328 TaxID=1705720 RepID=UPI00147468BB
MKKEFFCGIDVSKDKLDICFLFSNTQQKPKLDVLPNNFDLIETYFKRFVSDNLVVVFEPTSNYHLPLQQVLSSLKIKYTLLNSTKSSLFLRHLSSIKTDATDSYGLAVYARTFKSEINPSKYNPEYNKIKSYNS